VFGVATVLAILLTDGTKQRQQRDIERAKALWADYKRRRSRRNDDDERWQEMALRRRTLEHECRAPI
jgi:hypothetical protein